MAFNQNVYDRSNRIDGVRWEITQKDGFTIDAFGVNEKLKVIEIGFVVEFAHKEFTDSPVHATGEEGQTWALIFR